MIWRIMFSICKSFTFCKEEKKNEFKKKKSSDSFVLKKFKK